MASTFGTTIVVIWIFLWKFASAQSSVCPSACDCLFPMVDCSERGLTEIPTDLPNWVEILHLRSNEISKIQGDVFRGFTSIKQIDLSNNKLNSSHALMFRHLPHLQELKLAFNRFTEIPLLTSNTNLTKLVLHHNRITFIDSGRLHYLTRLRELDLKHNLITDLPNTTFPAGLPLEHLSLSNNKIRHVTRDVFHNITSLKSLKLNKNLLTSIEHKPFSQLASLKTLELMRNHIGKLTGMNFEGLSSLQTLKLRRNKLVISQDAPFYGLVKLQYLQLDGNKVTRLDNKLIYGLDSIQDLYLSANTLSTISSNWIKTFSSLRTLDISKNRLQTIGDDVFRFAPHLRHLDLSSNRLLHVEQTAFKSLGALEVLELANNHLSATIEDDQASTFMALRSLEQLGLQNNGILSISGRAFEGLDNLHQLHLERNNISDIQESAFDELMNLEKLHVNTTKLVCDCKMRWLPGWLERRRLRKTVNARCAYPEWMIGRDIMRVKEEEFICKDSPKPVMTHHPSKQGAIKGSNITLRCAAATSSSTEMRYQWKKNNKVIVDDDLYETSIFASTSDDEFTIFTSVLRIRHVGDEVAGRYHCILTNDFGVAYSDKAQIDVYVFPVITKIPGPITVKAGSSARLECAATGHPKPEVAWQKDGGNGFPAARERRLEMKNDDMFVIKDVNIGDQGVYSCTATNAAGVVVANATLTVLQPPSFVSKMSSDKYVKVGTSAVIECLSSGSPPPKVVWFKDSHPLNVTKRHFFAHDSRELLIIVETKKEDQGTYMCELSNTLGKTRGETQLYIQDPDSGMVGNEMPDAMTTTTGIIVISVVCCVVGTSLIWVIIIYQTRKKNEEYSTTPTDDTTIPGEAQDIVVHGDRELSTHSSDPSKSDHFLEYQGSQGSRGSHSSQESPRLFGKNGKLRTAAIFPSDVSDDDHHQLNSSEHHLVQNSENSIDRLCLVPSDSGSLRSCHSNHSGSHSGSMPFRTFKPHDGSTNSLPRVTDNPLTRFVETHEPTSPALVMVHGHAPSKCHNNNKSKVNEHPPPAPHAGKQCFSCNTTPIDYTPCMTCSSCPKCHLLGDGETSNCRPPGSWSGHPHESSSHSHLSPHKSTRDYLSNMVTQSLHSPPSSRVHNVRHPSTNQSESPLARGHLPVIPASIPVPPCRT